MDSTDNMGVVIGNCAVMTRGGAAGGIISHRRSTKASAGGLRVLVVDVADDRTTAPVSLVIGEEDAASVGAVGSSGSAAQTS